MGMTPAGQRNKLVAFQVRGAAEDALGGNEGATWAVAGSRLAKVLYGTGQERRAGAVEQASKAATFRFLADDLVRSLRPGSHRLVFADGAGGTAWDIADVTPIGGPVPYEIEVTAVVSRG